MVKPPCFRDVGSNDGRNVLILSAISLSSRRKGEADSGPAFGGHVTFRRLLVGSAVLVFAGHRPENSERSPNERTAPLAIQRPNAPAGWAMRIRNRGLLHGVSMDPMFPEKPALPSGLSDTGGVLWTCSSPWPALHTRVPITALIGPVVPVDVPPLMTSPWTKK